MKRQSKSPSSGSSQKAGSTSSFEQLVNTFGDNKVKTELLNNGGRPEHKPNGDI